MRPFELLTSFGRVQRRTHNKIFAVDSQLAVIGGRNIVVDYFDVHRSVNFRDVELLAAGPIPHAAVTSLDDFWNSPWVVPIEAFLKRTPTDPRPTRSPPSSRSSSGAPRSPQRPRP
jgi:cardiolipin synthase C